MHATAGSSGGATPQPQRFWPATAASGSSSTGGGSARSSGSGVVGLQHQQPHPYYSQYYASGGNNPVPSSTLAPVTAGSLPTAAAAATGMPGVGAAATPSQPQRGPAAAAVGGGVSSYHHPHQPAQQQRGSPPQPQQPQPQVGAAAGRVPGLGMAPSQSSYAAVVARGTAGAAAATAARGRREPSTIGGGPLYAAGSGGGRGQQEPEAQQPVNVGVEDAYGGAGMKAYGGEQQQHTGGQPPRHQQPPQQQLQQHHEGTSHYSAGGSGKGEAALAGAEAGIMGAMMMQPPTSPLMPAAAGGVPYQYYYYVPSPSGTEGAAGGEMEWGVVGGQGAELHHQPVYGVEGMGVVASPVMGPAGGGGAEGYYLPISYADPVAAAATAAYDPTTGAPFYPAGASYAAAGPYGAAALPMPMTAGGGSRGGGGPYAYPPGGEGGNGYPFHYPPPLLPLSALPQGEGGYGGGFGPYYRGGRGRGFGRGGRGRYHHYNNGGGHYRSNRGGFGPGPVTPPYRGAAAAGGGGGRMEEAPVAATAGEATAEAGGGEKEMGEKEEAGEAAKVPRGEEGPALHPSSSEEGEGGKEEKGEGTERGGDGKAEAEAGASSAEEEAATGRVGGGGYRGGREGGRRPSFVSTGHASDAPIAEAGPARFFVIKSFSPSDVVNALRHRLWASTEPGNARLDRAYREASARGVLIYLFFSVNESRRFCGVAQMASPVDLRASLPDWSFTETHRWKGSFAVQWLLVKDVPNAVLRHLRLPNNQMRPFPHSRDTQEVPYTQGMEALQIMSGYPGGSALLDALYPHEAAGLHAPPPLAVPYPPTSYPMYDAGGGGGGGNNNKAPSGFYDPSYPYGAADSGVLGGGWGPSSYPIPGSEFSPYAYGPMQPPPSSSYPVRGSHSHTPRAGNGGGGRSYRGGAESWGGYGQQQHQQQHSLPAGNSGGSSGSGGSNNSHSRSRSSSPSKPFSSFSFLAVAAEADQPTPPMPPQRNAHRRRMSPAPIDPATEEDGTDEPPAPTHKRAVATGHAPPSAVTAKGAAFPYGNSPQEEVKRESEGEEGDVGATTTGATRAVD